MRFEISKAKLSAIIIAILLLVIAVLGYNWWQSTRSDNPIPGNIMSQLDFSPLVIPSNTSGFKSTDFKYSEVEDEAKVLSFNLKTPAGEVVVSEYTQQAAFAEIPGYKEEFLKNKQDRTVQTASGVINISRAAKEINGEVGLMLENGLVVWINPMGKTLSDSDWRTIGDNLVLKRK